MYRRIWAEAARLDFGLEVGGRSLVSGPLLGHVWHRQATCIPAVLRSHAQSKASPSLYHSDSLRLSHRQDWRHVSTPQPVRAISSMATGAQDKSDPPAEADLSDRHILRELLVHLWPKDNPEFRTRVVGALGLLVGSKLLNIQVCHTIRLPSWPGASPPGASLALNKAYASYHDRVQVPFLFKYTVDALATPAAVDPALATTAALTAPVALIAAYGCARGGTAVMSELRNAVFAKVAQGAIRKVGRQVCAHGHPAPASA